jgi:hypothetical protein
MKKNALILIAVMLLLVSCNEDKKNLTQVNKNVPDIQYNTESEAYQLLSTQCYICHSIISTSHDALIAPPMVAVKKRYSRLYKSKDEFVNAFTKWALNPNKEDAIMFGAVTQFNVMPKQNFKEEDIKKIATYIFENELEQPVWFNAHQKEMQGANRKVMGKNN